MRRHHDMGGLPADVVQATEHAYEPWENKTDAILRLLANPSRGPLVRVDELRRAIEDMGPGIYDELTYYERWIAAISQVLIEKGVLSVDEVGRKIEDVKARHSNPQNSIAAEGQ